MKELVIYTSKQCSKCFERKLLFDEKNIAYVEVQPNEEGRKQLRKLGATTFPIVEYDNTFYIGNEIDKLVEKLIKGK